MLFFLNQTKMMAESRRVRLPLTPLDEQVPYLIRCGACSSLATTWDVAKHGELSLSYAPNALTMLYPELYMMSIGGNVEGGLSMNNMVFFNENSGNLVFQPLFPGVVMTAPDGPGCGPVPSQVQCPPRLQNLR